MYVFSTTYVNPGVKSKDFLGVDSRSFEIHASNYEEAVRLARDRGLNEVVSKNPVPIKDWNRANKLYSCSKQIRDEDFKSAAHTATIMAYVGIRSGVITMEEMLADNGLLHELIHVISFGSDSRYNRPTSELIEMAYAMEKRLPGWLDPDSV